MTASHRKWIVNEIYNKRSQNACCRGPRTWKTTTSVLRTLVVVFIYDCVDDRVLATSNPFTMDLYTLFNPPASHRK